MSATLSFVKKRGSDATIETFSSSGTDSQGDPTWSATPTSTKAIVHFTGGRSEVTVRTASGEETQIDAEIVVPKDDAVDPAGEDRKPEITVEGKRYVIQLLDPHVLGEVRRLLCTLSRA